MTSRRLGTILTALLMLAVTGCSDGNGEQTSSPESSDSSTPTEPTSETTSETTSDPPETTDPPEVEGTPYELEGLSFVLPEPYRGRKEGDFVLARIGPDDPVAYIAVSAVPSDGTLSFDDLVKTHLRGHFYATEPKRLEPATVDGVSMFHLAGQTNEVTWTEVFGTDEPGYTIDIALDFSADVPEAERQQVVDALIGSVQLAG